MWKWISRIIIGLAILVLAIRIVDRLARRSGPLPVVPEPNGYATLVIVARGVTLPKADLADLSEDEIRRIAAVNREPLEKLHAALRTETGVPLQVEPRWADKHAEDVKHLKRLAVTLGVQSRAEALEGNTNNAARWLLDVILLGQAMARGGLLSDGINALAVETLGTASIRALAPQLDAATCRGMCQELEREEERREKPGRILQTEKDWCKASFGLVRVAGGLFWGKAEGQRLAEFTGRYHKTMGRTRRLMLTLAARAVEMETGQPVTSPAMVVPGVLKTVPVDPETNTPMTEIPGSV